MSSTGDSAQRISRAVEGDPKLDGTISLSDLGYESYGWEVVPYLEPIVIDGVVYAHYFTSGVMGRPVTSAAALLSKKHMSAVMGHVQNRQIAYANRADGSQITGLFSGCCYLHDEDYLGSQGNKYWRGIWMLSTRIGGSVIVSANSEAQLRSITWSEITKWLASISDKTARARPIQARASMGKVFLPKKADWKEHVLSHL